MGIRDLFNGMLSYFDTNEETDYEENTKEEVKANPVPKPKPQSKPVTQQNQRPQNERPTIVPQTRRQTLAPDLQDTQVLRSVPQFSRSQARQEQTSLTVPSTKTTIAIKYPKKYEDAQEIVDLLIVNECVLIDFQYMLEAQARRCLDFIDGASKVLTGNLQKVGSSMYLLTPVEVVVDMEEIGLAHGNQEANFDFDMKRR